MAAERLSMVEITIAYDCRSPLRVRMALLFSIMQQISQKYMNVISRLSLSSDHRV